MTVSKGYSDTELKTSHMPLQQGLPNSLYGERGLHLLLAGLELGKSEPLYQQMRRAWEPRTLHFHF